jgi:hypothetical protein
MFGRIGNFSTQPPTDTLIVATTQGQENLCRSLRVQQRGPGTLLD